MFGFFKRIADRTSAALLVQDWLEELAQEGHLSRSPAAFANKLVQMAWEIWPTACGGPPESRASRYTVAVASVAAGIKLLSVNDSDRVGLELLFGQLLSRLGEGQDPDQFGAADDLLMEEAEAIYFDAAQTGAP